MENIQDQPAGTKPPPQNLAPRADDAAVRAETVTLSFNGRKVAVPADTPNLLEAARLAGIHIPSLCYLKDLNQAGSCRVCLVEIDNNGNKTLQASCVYPVSKGLKINTNSPRVRRARKRVVELLLSEHDLDCINCVRTRDCELKNVAGDLGIRRIRLTGERREYKIADKNSYITRDYNKCIKCRRCEAVCSNVQGVNVLAARNRGFDTVIGPAFMKDLSEADCVACGQCVMACPTAALAEKEYIDQVWQAIEDPEKLVVVQTAPATQVSLGEAFGHDPGTVVTGKMVAALRRLGFDRVFSTVLAADLTIIEEAHELLERLEGKGKLPLISSCSPGWVKYCEHFYPQFVANLSTCKSPQEMLGALAKTYYADKEELDPRKMVVVAVMPCTAKKYEAARPELVTRGGRDVDFVLTTRELARMIREAGLEFDTLPDEEFDLPLGLSTGAGNIFAATGGVMEAAIRTAYALAGDEHAPPKLDFREFRGLRGVKEATIELKGQKIRLAVAHGTRNARQLMERLKAGEKFDFIEIMGCPGGCVGGGGQPIFPGHRDPVKAEAVYKKRAQALYNIDLGKAKRRAHENPAVQSIYAEYLGQPLSAKAKEILHTCYTPRGRAAKKLLH